MNVYTPNLWVIVKVTKATGNNREDDYRVFGSWRGSFAEGERWRMNSGIVSCSVKDGSVYFGGGSGSLYKVREENYGMTAWTASVLESFKEMSKVKVELLPEEEARELIKTFPPVDPNILAEH